jgi:hypothetical protein
MRGVGSELSGVERLFDAVRLHRSATIDGPDISEFFTPGMSVGQAFTSQAAKQRGRKSFGFDLSRGFSGDWSSFCDYVETFFKDLEDPNVRYFIMTSDRRLYLRFAETDDLTWVTKGLIDETATVTGKSVVRILSSIWDRFRILAICERLE